jgi:dihydrofolate reductase
MRRVTVTVSVSLDGVMQGPGRADEDTSGGFDRGGWATPYVDEVMMAKMGEGMSRPGALLLGRRTFIHFASYWPHQTDNPFTDRLTSTQKYVVSNTLVEPVEWENSTVLSGDAAEVVADLKHHDGPDLAILGSGELIRSLRRANLVDEYVLSIHPLVLGSGRRLFDDGDAPSPLTLVESLTTSTGVVIATYRAGNGTA